MQAHYCVLKRSGGQTYQHFVIDTLNNVMTLDMQEWSHACLHHSLNSYLNGVVAHVDMHLIVALKRCSLS